MNAIDNYIATLNPPQASIVKELRNLVISDFPQLKEEYKWSQPVYTFNGKDIVYIQATKQGANIGYILGSELDDPQQLLEGTGKDMRHIKILSPNSIDAAYLKKLIEQSINKMKESR